MAPNGPDRCLAAVYPEKTTALDYLPENALVCVEESGRTAEALRGWLWQLKEDVSAGMEAGFLAGELADFAASEQELAARLEKRPTVQLDSLTTGRQLLAPKDLLQLTAKQLSSYGGSLELACTDLTHYLTAGYRVMVLCGGEVRARNLRQMLADRKIPAAVDLTGEKSPEKGTVLIAVGALSAGCEYPEGRLAVLTEGQLTTPLSGRSKKPRPKRDSNQQKLQSYTDLTPGTWWSTPTTASAGSWPCCACRWTGWRRTISRSPTPGRTCCTSRPRPWTWSASISAPARTTSAPSSTSWGHRVGQDHPEGQGRRQGPGGGADPAVCPAAAAGRPCLLAGQPLAAGV